VEVSRDGRGSIFTNSLYGAHRRSSNRTAMQGLDREDRRTKPEGGMKLDPEFFVELAGGNLPHQVRLQAATPPRIPTAISKGRDIGGSQHPAGDERALAWLVVAGLGMYHGVHPAMGWLFAVALACIAGAGRWCCNH